MLQKAVTGALLLSAGMVHAGTITGVINDDIGSPLGDTAGVVIFDDNGMEIERIVASGGAYTSSDLPAGDYRLHTFNNVGFIDEIYDNVDCMRQCSVQVEFAGMAVTVPMAGTVTGIDFELSPGSSFLGNVSASVGGAPIPDTEVCAYVDVGSGFAFPTGVCDLTDASGNYGLGGLPGGTDYFLATTPGSTGTFFPEVFNDVPFDGFSFLGAAVQAVDGVADTVGIDFSLDEGAELRLTVNNAGMGPVTSLVVTPFDPQFNVPLPPVAEFPPDGIFSRVFAPGDYIFLVTPDDTDFPNLMGQFVTGSDCVPDGHCFDPAGSGAPTVTLTAGNVSNHVVNLLEGVSVSGNVASGGSPVAGAAVLVELPNGIIVHATDSAITDASGDYTTQLVPQRDDLRIKALLREGDLIPEFFDNKPFPPNFANDADPIDTRLSNPSVVGNDLPGIDFDLAQGALLTGSITDPSLPMGSNGILDAQLDVYFDDGGFLLTLPIFPMSDGTYRADHGIPPGDYHVVIRQGIGEPYVSEIHDGSPCPGGFGCDFGPVTPLTLVLGDNQLDVQLENGGIIDVTVNEEGSGMPLPGVPVEFFDGAGTVIGSLGTDPTGNVRVAVPSGVSHYVATSDGMRQNEMFDDIPCPGGPACSVAIGQGATPLAPMAGGADAVITIELGGAGPGFNISGQVVADADAMPLQGIEVCPFLPDGAFVGPCTFTDSMGNYTLGPLPADVYAVHAAGIPSGFLDQLFFGQDCLGPCDFMQALPVGLGPDATNVDFSLTAAVGQAIEGIVTDSSTQMPLQDVLVSLQSVNPQAKGLMTVDAANTDATGLFQFTNVPPGEYRVVYSKDGFTTEQFGRRFDGGIVYCDNTLFCPERVLAPVAVMDRNIAGIDATLDPAGQLMGLLLDGQSMPISTAPGEASIAILDNSGQFVTEAFQTFGVPYDINLPLGTYFLVGTVQDGSGFIDTAFGDVACPFGTCDLNMIATPVVIGTQGGMTLADINMLLGATINGTVLEDAAGMPPVQATEIFVYDATGRLVTEAETDMFGMYLTRTGLPDGDYYVATVNTMTGQGVFDFTGLPLIDEVFGDLFCTGGLCDPTTGTAVTLNLGMSPTETADFGLALGGFVAGQVTNQSGNPVAGVLVNAFDGGGTRIAVAESERDGQYMAGPLPAGTYFASTDASARGFFDQIFQDMVCIGSICESGVTGGTPIMVAIPPAMNNPLSADFMLSSGGNITAANLEAQDNLGASVAICGGRIAVGVPGDDDMGENAGAVLVYRKNGLGYEFVPPVIYANPPVAGSMFGSTVSCGGDFFVFGATGDGVGAKQGTPPDKSAYVFQLTGNGSMNQVQQLLMQNLDPSANFGSAIALDGNSMAIGAPGAENGGAVVMYNNAGGANPWSMQVTISDPDVGSNGNFGAAVDVSNGMVVVGAPNAPSTPSNPLAAGVVEMFTAVSGTNNWSQVGKFTNTDPGAAAGDGDQFGASVSISGNMIAVGAPGSDAMMTDGGAAFIFEAGGNFNQLANLFPTAQGNGDSFGSAVDLVSGQVAIGANGANSNAGAAFVFELSGNQWTETRRIDAQGGSAGDGFGSVVAFDGNSVVVGAPNNSGGGAGAGNVQVFSDEDVLFTGNFENTPR